MEIRRLALPLLLAGGTLTNVALLLRPDAKAPESISAQISREMSHTAEQVGPAVVSILSLGAGRSGLTGSGVLLREDGLIVTNNHVIRGAQRVTVTLLDGRKLKAEVIGTDPESDLALLDIQGSGYPTAKLGSSEPPAVGSWVLAIGNPLGFDHTVTSGIISARGRTGIDVATYEDFLQTDAAINSGNSGGPLVNLKGEVVGLNTAIELVQGNQGLGFAIPAHMIQKVVDDIVEKGYVERGYFGIAVEGMSATACARRGLSSVARVQVSRVEKGTPAERAGFRTSDILLEISGNSVQSERQLFDDIADLNPGSKVSVDVWRRGRREVLLVTVGDRNKPG